MVVQRWAKNWKCCGMVSSRVRNNIYEMLNIPGVLVRCIVYMRMVYMIIWRSMKISIRCIYIYNYIYIYIQRIIRISCAKKSSLHVSSKVHIHHPQAWGYSAEHLSQLFNVSWALGARWYLHESPSSTDFGYMSHYGCSNQHVDVHILFGRLT